ncbi:DUF6705 family protein [Elizabethkingia miricola]|uniref:DUF6705 family protein n=1 Tax=Elizabethkingia miricola TaxID=172045 RepID=UPI003891FD07
MKKIIFSIILLSCIYTKAQIIPLSSTNNITTGMYLKDIDNILPLFTGTWIAKYENNRVILNIEKIEKHPSKEEDVNYYMDVAFLRYSIIDSHNKEIYSTLNKNIKDIGILTSLSASSLNKTVGFEYEGEECHIGEGLITLTYRDPTHVIWEYISTEKAIDKAKCPNVDNIKSYVPKAYELVFTKQ